LLSEFWRRNSARGTDQFRPLVLDHRGAHFVNRQGSPAADARSVDPLEVRTKNAVYCAIVFKEFLKELAAISQEHVLMQFDLGNV
jgi:KELAA motif